MDTMPLKIWLDDFRPAPEGWTVAHTVEQAQVLIMTHPVEAISLDCDLDEPNCEKCKGGCGLRDQGCLLNCDCHSDGDENGLELLYWMQETGRWTLAKPQVHSHNLHGALRMKAFIEENWPYN